MSTTEISTAQAQFREMVRVEWTDKTTIESWRKWHPKMTVQLQAMSDALLQAAGVRPDQSVLDLASGTGQPALDLARAVGTRGHVTASDLSPAMLSLVEQHAREAGLSNLTTTLADAESLPFPDGSFDAVTSRIGAMYFIDIQRALSEIRRVLRPGGRVALAVWGPGDQGTYINGMLGPFLSRVVLPEPAPQAPSPFRFAAQGALADELRRASFVNVEERTSIIAAPWPGTPEEYWQQFYDVAVPMRPVFDSLQQSEFDRARAEAIGLLRREFDGNIVHTTLAMVLAAGAR